MSSTNRGTATGRLASDPRSFVAESGDKHVFMTLMVDRPCKANDGSRPSDAIPLETWVRADTEGLGPWSHVGRGDLIQVGYTVRSSNYADKTTGEVRYSTILLVEEMAFLEPKSIT